LYASADIVCSPATVGESQGVVLLEAMASGKPCVCFAIAGYRDVIRDGYDGVLVDDVSCAALSRSIARLHADPALRGRLGACARQTASTYAWPLIAARLEAALLTATR
jgi:phosphatidylinositol alpha-mannosyltransferase